MRYNKPLLDAEGIEDCSGGDTAAAAAAAAVAAERQAAITELQVSDAYSFLN